MNSFSLTFLSSLLLVLLALRGSASSVCRPSGRIRGKNPPPGQCNTGDDSDCCKDGQTYPVYRCSPPVSGHTGAHLTLNSFEEGGDGGGPSKCDNRYLRNITIYGNGRSVQAMVVDECDSTMGCDEEHDYQPPCNNNIVDASRAMWEALGVPKDN
ncbi:LOW QUALITY PROTEIN: hypothetical protein BT93_I1128 [Corymbia citriodora subsp. variegata]|nr:LOW QUALITY PROTEIN: hypothetical protein BT93_I1128 [Corymbia citriodora subsp. variegata]